MKKLLALALSVALFLTVVSPALACPTPNPEFGEHISSMAVMGASTSDMFSACVSSMASGNGCACDMDGGCMCDGSMDGGSCDGMMDGGM